MVVILFSTSDAYDYYFIQYVFICLLLRLWVNATKGKHGYVLASVAGNMVNFALSLNTTGSDTLANFLYMSNKVCKKLKLESVFVLSHVLTDIIKLSFLKRHNQMLANGELQCSVSCL